FWMAIQSFRCHDNFFHLCLDKGDIIDNSISVFYSNGKKGILFDQNVKGNHNIYMDNERTDFTKIEIDGQEYLLFESDTDVTCIWDNGRYILSISGNLDKETVIDLCKSTKLQK
ncbi:DUF4367 domain-containing protein, partial [Ruminococcus bicirculans (ex Wegman et al. 2014)]|uniref:DUF4367 domain-containing protein n=2 Tax=Ruminococcus bicirculans (ex Wegman et al. 2014) TaxID=1160721 RepID=UPI00325BA9CA